MKKIFSILFLLLLVVSLTACNKEPDKEEENKDKEEELIPTLEIESKEYTLHVGDTLQLEVVVGNVKEGVSALYQTIDAKIATVSRTGKVEAINEGEATIRVMIASHPDVFIDINIIVLEAIPDDIKEALLDFADIKEVFDEIPLIIEEDLGLYTTMFGRRVTWTSSNQKVLNMSGSRPGRVNRQIEDVEVEISVSMKYKDLEETYTKVVTVKKYELRDISNKKVVFGYTNNLNMPEDHMKEIDVLNFSFGTIVNGKLSVTSLLSTLVNSAHKVGTRVVVAVGGWGGSGFSTMARTSESRKVFIDSVIALMEEYNFDGLDYDWEYPTSTASGDLDASPEDKQNFSLLIKETKEAFDEFREGLIVSAAVVGGTWGVNQYYDIAELNKYIDYFHIMSYDYNNFPADGGLGLTKHHTNLYKSTIFGFNGADDAIQTYLNAGASSQKLILGIAFYGRIATEVSSSTNGMNAMGKNPAGSISFNDIYNQYLAPDKFNPNYYFYDETAEAPWIFDGSTFISFDDTRSVTAKCNYVIENNLGGVMFWNYVHDPNGYLLDTISDLLN